VKNNLGFIGLGAMGLRMAKNLAATEKIVGYDVADPSIAEEGIHLARSVAEVGSACETVCLSLPHSEAVEEVVLGRDGLAAAMGPGGVIVDLSTTEPRISLRLARELAAMRISFADAPVSGGVAGAEQGTLSIMVGASEKDFRRIFPVLNRLGSKIVRVGEVGAGGVAKLANNMIVGAAFASIAESFAMAEKAGIEAEKLYEAIREGWAGSPVLDVAAGAMISKDYSPKGTVQMLAKDLNYARNFAKASYIPLPVTSVVQEILTAAEAVGLGGNSQAAILELWRPAIGGKKPQS
jgi:2-hydroxy-3-oxopropionate reductase